MRGCVGQARMAVALKWGGRSVVRHAPYPPGPSSRTCSAAVVKAGGKKKAPSQKKGGGPSAAQPASMAQRCRRFTGVRVGLGPNHVAHVAPIGPLHRALPQAVYLACPNTPKHAV